MLAGATVGYFVAMGRLEKKYYQKHVKHVEETEDFFRRKYEKKIKELDENEEARIAANLVAMEAFGKYSGEKTGEVIPATDSDLIGLIDDALDPDLQKIREALSVFPAEVDPETDEEILDTAGEGSPVPEQPEDRRRHVFTDYRTISAQKQEALVGNSRRDISVEPIQTRDDVEDPKEIEIITFEQFRDQEDNNYKQFQLTYFAGDQIMTNQHDDEVDETTQKKYFGEEALALIRSVPEARGGSDAVYVRNHNENGEFEIVIEDGTYVDTVGHTEE